MKFVLHFQNMKIDTNHGYAFYNTLSPGIWVQSCSRKAGDSRHSSKIIRADEKNAGII